MHPAPRPGWKLLDNGIASKILSFLCRQSISQSLATWDLACPCYRPCNVLLDTMCNRNKAHISRAAAVQGVKHQLTSRDMASTMLSDRML